MFSMLRLLVFLFKTACPWVLVLFALAFVTSNLWEYETLYRHWACHGVLIRQSDMPVFADSENHLDRARLMQDSSVRLLVFSHLG
jgi:hypothetical protein